MSKKIKHYKTPKIEKVKKENNPPTIITTDIFTVEDANLLSNLNIFPLIIKGTFSELFFELNENVYYRFKQGENQETYAKLDVKTFLKKFEIEREVRLLLSGRENPIIHHGRVKDGDIILCTENYNIKLSTIIEEIFYEPEPKKVKTKK